VATYKKIMIVFKYKKLLSALTIIFVGAFSFVLYFNRAPERITPEGNVVVSPASGDVIHIEEVNTNNISFFKKDLENTLTVQGIEPPYTIVVIEMDPADVHVQRAPISGQVVYQKHTDGYHKNALWSENVHKLANENEKNIVVLENEEISVGVIQVAGIMARRIVSYVSPTNKLEKGDIYGRIKLGSQVVIIVPADIPLNISTGDALIDGESIIGVY
jgi:phosphatidylserine decarboxylase